MAGDEVVQLYIEGGDAPDDPVRELRGFERIHLGPGETREVTFTIPPENVPETTRNISVGGGQPVGSIPWVEGEM